MYWDEKFGFLLFVDLQHSVDNWDLSAFYPEDDNLADSDWIFYSVGQKKEVSSVESWFHTTAVMMKI